MSVAKDHLRLLECDITLIIVSKRSDATKAEMLQNAARFTHKPMQHVAFWPPYYGKEFKAEMLRNVAQSAHKPVQHGKPRGSMQLRL